MFCSVVGFWGSSRTFFPYMLFSSALMTKYFSPARCRPFSWTAFTSLLSLKAETTSWSSSGESCKAGDSVSEGDQIGMLNIDGFRGCGPVFLASQCLNGGTARSSAQPWLHGALSPPLRDSCLKGAYLKTFRCCPTTCPLCIENGGLVHMAGTKETV